MKKLLLIICCLCATELFAQTEAETLEWMNVKKADVWLNWCHSSTVKDDAKVSMNDEGIKLYNSKGAFTKGDWKDIKEIKQYDDYCESIYNRDYNGDPVYIKLRFSSKELAIKFAKAIEHMAKLKGAKLINKDLF